ncbi:MAG: chemotaxis protein CheW [Pirellulales bacterium]|jgi:purine-binding chemotaxis protein CheW|nr:chemotaxis protein CheW [Pirellulales bacterium]MEE2797232.1 chemotaxis protein CheW [Planctomycetota bacterium]|tara:strand:+ start:687 stop:1166 length:480 start_codon:yes stop_codon:yes gene_type:complete
MNSIVKNTPKEEEQKRCCTFLIENTCFAFEADNVTEVLQKGIINNVPLSPPAISGLINLRGQIVPAIDLRVFLEFPAAPTGINSISLIVDINNEWYCFLVDKLLDVKAYDPHQVTSPTNNTLRALTGVLPDAERLIHFLSPEKILKALLNIRTESLSVG